MQPAAVAIVSAVCWMDLYDYGRDLERAGFDPTHPNAGRPITRLRAFHGVVAKHSGPSFPTLAMNDGAAINYDLGLGPNDKLWKFIRRCWALYGEATATDLAAGGAGLRSVLAIGLRAKGSARGIDAQDDAFTGIVEDFAAGKIDRAAAINAARQIRRNFDIVPELQANFAFARAYEAERGGTRAGLPGPNFYVDKLAFRNAVPGWLDAIADHRWIARLQSLSTTFVSVAGLNSTADDSASSTLRSGRELKALLQGRA